MKKRFKVIIGVIIVAVLVFSYGQYSIETNVETVENDDEMIVQEDGEHSESDHIYETDPNSGNITYQIKVEAAMKAKEKIEEEYKSKK